MKPEIYVSTDIESDGPIPGPNSMLSFASAALVPTPGGPVVECFSANLELLPDAKPDPETGRFWATRPAAYAATRENTLLPQAAMLDYVRWLKALPGNPVFVAYPAGFDFTFVYWYLMKFAGESPFGFQALDMKTYAMALLDTPFRYAVKRKFPLHWFPKNQPHTHVALDDAREQLEIFRSMLRYRKDLCQRHP